MLSLVIGISVWRTTRPQKILSLRLTKQAGLECGSVEGERTSCRVLPDSAVFNHLVVLRLTLGEEDRPCSLPLLSDSMPKEQFRILRLWLRYAKESVESDV